MSHKRGLLLMLAAGFVGFVLVNVPPVHDFTALVGLTPSSYSYVSSDEGYRNFEMPLKGRDHRMVELQFRSYCEDVDDPDVALCRTFSRDWWRFWCWIEYATHPRWEHPFTPPPASDEG